MEAPEPSGIHELLRRARDVTNRSIEEQLEAAKLVGLPMPEPELLQGPQP